MTEQSGKLKALLMKTKTELKQRTAEVESFTKGSADLAVQSEERAREVEDLKVNLANVTVALSSAQAEQREIEMAKDLEIRNLRFELETAQREAAQVRNVTAPAPSRSRPFGQTRPSLTEVCRTLFSTAM